MKIYTKILAATLPLVFFFLIGIMGISYYASRSALTDLAEEWLSARSYEAVKIIKKHENILHKYGLEKIPASMIKAKLDAIKELSSIKIGKKGYFFIVDTKGIILFHPNKHLGGMNVSHESWFHQLKNNHKQLFFTLENKKNFAICDFFPAWNWFILVVDPEEEVFGLADRMKPYLIFLGISSAIIISLALMLLTRHLMKPLQLLVKGAEKIGQGQLDTQISIQTRDELADLAREFNRMASRLKKGQTALKYSEEYFRALIENSTDVVIITNDKGEIIYTSPSIKRILGYDKNEIIGNNLFDYSHPDEYTQLTEIFYKRVRSEIASHIIESRFKHHEGYWCTMEYISKNLLTHPAVKGFVINSRDISKRKAAEDALKKSHETLEQRVEERTRELVLSNQTLSREIQERKIKESELEKANLVKNEFLANISHEIRTPLNSVIGFSELLMTMVTTKEEINYLTAIHTAGSRLLSLMNDILDLAKIESGRFELHRVSVDINGLLDEVCQLFQSDMKKKSIRFIKNLDEHMPLFLLMDDIRLQQILVNLVGNAVKFTSKGYVKVSLKTIKSHESIHKLDLELSVEDTGIGIPEDRLDTIFDSFRQASSRISREYGGTGLGLSICRHLVKLMGGRIQVESIVGKGSVFTLVFPEIEISPSITGIPERPAASLKAGPEKNRPENRLSVEILKDYCSEQHGLKHLLNTYILQHIPERKEGIKIKDVQTIIANIISTGDRFHIPELTEFGEELSEYARSFDIEKLDKNLQTLYTILKSLSCK